MCPCCGGMPGDEKDYEDFLNTDPRKQPLTDADLLWYKVPAGRWIATLTDSPHRLLAQVNPPKDRAAIRTATTLLNYQGIRVAIPWLESTKEHLRLVKNGRPKLGDNVILLEVDRNSCHKNVARLFVSHPGEFRIASGFALGIDGMWQSHSWLVEKDDFIVETTVPRMIYYGTVLDKKCSYAFGRNEGIVG
jgi:hypothetical protein